MRITSASNVMTTEIPTKSGEETQVSALGTFGGATATLYVFLDGLWRPVPDGVFTEPFEVVRVNGPGTSLRLSITGASVTTDLSINLTSLP